MMDNSFSKFKIICIKNNFHKLNKPQNKNHQDRKPGFLTTALSRPDPTAFTLWAPPPTMGPTVNWNGLPVNH